MDARELNIALVNSSSLGRLLHHLASEEAVLLRSLSSFLPLFINKTFFTNLGNYRIANQAKNMQKESEAGMDAPERKRFITRKETARLLHVNYTTLWRWNKQGYLRSRKVGGRHVMYKYSDVMALLNG